MFKHLCSCCGRRLSKHEIDEHFMKAQEKKIKDLEYRLRLLEKENEPNHSVPTPRLKLGFAFQ